MLAPGDPAIVNPSMPVEGLNPYNLAIPEKFGKVEEIFQGNPGAPVIVHIQDAHANYEAQLNIKNILAHLSKNYNMNLIQLEGASSKLNPAVFETAYLKEANRKLADYLMREGRLSGAEAFAIETEKPVELHGIENRMLYMENLRTFRSVYAHQAEISDYFKCLRTLAKDLRNKLLNEELLDLTRNMEAYAQEKIDLVDYLLYLDGLAEKHKLASLKQLTEITRFPNLVRIMRLHELEKQLDEKQLKKESLAIKAAFLKKTSDPEVEELLSSLDLKKKGMKPRAYFKKISTLAEQHGIDLLAYSQMRAMSEFLILQDEIEHHGLFSEVHRLEKIIQKKLFKTRDERHLIQLLRDMELLEQYFKLEVNREKLAYVIRHYDAMRASYIKTEMDKLAEKFEILPTDYKGDTLKIDQIMDDVEYFYRVVLERDRLFVENMMAKTKSAGADRTVLITGGFHTDGLTTLLKKQNVSYLVVIPKVDVKQGNEKYIKIMTEGDSEVGSVFAGTFAVQLELNSGNPLAHIGPAGPYATLLRLVGHLGAAAAIFEAASRDRAVPNLEPQRQTSQQFNKAQPFIQVALVNARFNADDESVTVVQTDRLLVDGKVTETTFETRVHADGSFEIKAVRSEVLRGDAAVRALADLRDLNVLRQNVPQAETPSNLSPLSEVLANAVVQTATDARSNDTPEVVTADSIIPFPGTLIATPNLPRQILATLAGFNPSALQRVAEAIKAGQPLTQNTLGGIQAQTQAADVTSADIAAAVPDDSTRVQQLAALFGLTQGNKTRVLVVPVMDESENSKSQLISLRETMQSNKGAAAVVIGKKAQDFAAAVFGMTLEQLKRDPVLGRMQFVDVKEGKDVLAETVDVVKRQAVIAKAYAALDRDFKTLTMRDLFGKGYVRVLVPEGAKVGENAVGDLLQRASPGVVQFQSKLQNPKVVSNPSTGFAYATIEVKGANLVPAEDENQNSLQDDGLNDYIKFDSKTGTWSITSVEALVEALVRDFLAAREIAIRA